jgi:DNA-binding CsgD family transcriptional regulator
LSAREREILALVAAGLPNKLIGQRLGIAEKTVKVQLTTVYRTIRVTTAFRLRSGRANGA